MILVSLHQLPVSSFHHPKNPIYQITIGIELTKCREGIKISIIDLLNSFVVGIASGIVSSIIVTAAYRLYDRERDRQIYFAALQTYINSIVRIGLNDTYALIEFTKNHKLPKQYRWVHLNKVEQQIVDSAKKEDYTLSRILSNFYFESRKIPKDEIDNLWKSKFRSEVIDVVAELAQIAIKVRCLGEKVLMEELGY